MGLGYGVCSVCTALSVAKRVHSQGNCWLFFNFFSSVILPVLSVAAFLAAFHLRVKKRKKHNINIICIYKEKYQKLLHSYFWKVFPFHFSLPHFSIYNIENISKLCVTSALICSLHTFNLRMPFVYLYKCRADEEMIIILMMGCRVYFVNFIICEYLNQYTFTDYLSQDPIVQNRQNQISRFFKAPCLVKFISGKATCCNDSARWDTWHCEHPLPPQYATV